MPDRHDRFVGSLHVDKRGYGVMTPTDSTVTGQTPARGTLACQEPGCSERGQECFLPNEDEPSAWYCENHAPDHGFCAWCGGFCAGAEGFEFWIGVCEACRGDIDDDEDDDYDTDHDLDDTA